MLDTPIREGRFYYNGLRSITQNYELSFLFDWDARN